MVDVQRYRSGPYSEVKSKVRAGVDAEVGDLVALNASGQLETFTSGSYTSATFRTLFLGVLTQGGTRGTATADTTALVYTSGEFEYPLSAPAGAAVQIGGLVKATASQVVATGGVLGAAGTGDAIGRLARAVAVGDTTCLVAIASSIMAPAQPLT